ncbi:MAG TPA: hypothetical protein VN428_04390 [Bryobacteraceae bacterium]|nr:hypothetical protein [Bryobacteraceae bacterium]
MKHPVVLVAALAAPLLAGDAWNDKKPAEWNEKEVRAVLDPIALGEGSASA